MKKLNQISPASISLGLSTLILAGCATRPPRQVGPPPKPVMPPMVQGSDLGSLPPPTPIDFDTPVIQEVLPPPVVQAPAPQPRKGSSYTIRKGESLSAIAARNNMSWRELAEYNYLSDPNKVRVGQVILIPNRNVSSSDAAKTPSVTRAAPPPPANSGNTYVVQSGDSLSVIARRYGSSVNELKTLNDLKSDRLLVGQILKLPSGATASSSTPNRTPPAPRPTPQVTLPTPTPLPSPLLDLEVDSMEPVIEDVAPMEEDPVVSKAFPIVVQEGDTLESIANNYIVPVEEIRKLNKLSPTAEVKPGQKLQIPPSVY